MRTLTLMRKFCGKTTPISPLTRKMKELVPMQREKFTQWKAENANKRINKNMTVRQILDMKGVISMICETSYLEPEKGIHFRGRPLDKIFKMLPKYQENLKGLPEDSLQPLPESVLWLFLTGQIPTKEESTSVTKNLFSRSYLPDYTIKMIDSFPRGMHPMVQLSSAILSLSEHSKFRSAYFSRVPKATLWQYTLEDGLDLIAKIPLIAARIYRNLYRNGENLDITPSGDLSSHFSRLLGFDSFEFFELMRLYLTLHSDHEGGNVSSHATHLVGSALNDPFISYSAGINGLSGPLHGLANQEVLDWVIGVDRKLPGDSLTMENLSKEIHRTLDSGQVVPGFGHAVLRVTDPRYTCQQQFAKTYLNPEDRLYRIVRMANEIVPSILKGIKKIQNPYPNVDGHSGVLLNYMGLKESKFFTVLFSVSRAIGVVSNLTISRIYGLPIERPKSATTQWVSENID